MREEASHPLEVHSPGEADGNLYAYVEGAALKAIDAAGLRDKDIVGRTAEGAFLLENGDLLLMDGSVVSKAEGETPSVKFVPTKRGHAPPSPASVMDPAGWKRLTMAEKGWATRNPLDAYQINEARQEAWTRTGQYFEGGHNDGEADAFRHAYWNALAAYKTGAPDEVKEFTDLHELSNPAHADPENTYAMAMDLHNNAVGLQIGREALNSEELQASGQSVEDYLADRVLEAVSAGDLVVAAPGAHETEDVAQAAQAEPAAGEKQ